MYNGKTRREGEKTVLNPSKLKVRQEQWEYYYSHIDKSEAVQYTYRHTDDHLYSVVAPTVAIARELKRQWLANRPLAEYNPLEES